jgi:hypothetical protein
MTVRGLVEQVRTRLLAWHANQPLLFPVAAFGVGVLIGWWLLGWLIFPVLWTDCWPSDLRADWQASYVQGVADGYAVNGDLTAAQFRLDGIEGEALQKALTTLTAQTASEVSRQHAEQLATALQSAPTPAGPTAPPPPSGAARLLPLLRALALVMLGLAVAAGVAIAWRSLRSRPQPAPTGDELAVTQAFALPTAARPHGAAPPWRPERIDLGATVTAHYQASDDRFYQTWLVYDERGGLLGGAGLQALDVGGATTLELWFFERDEEGEGAETPIVTIVSQHGYGDKMFRARLGNRRIVAAVPGQQVRLETADLVLRVHILTVEPDAASDLPNLAAVSLSLTPERAAATPAPEEPEPPIPLPFRRD